MIIKVCGMTNEDNLKAIAPAMPDYFGFIFYEKSPRALKINSLPSIEDIKKIGVFVNTSTDFIVESQQQFNLNGVQLHGEEDKIYVKELKEKLPDDIKIFKAISIKETSDFKTISIYEGYVDLIVLDTKTKLKGGSGQKFDWNLLDHYKANIPFLLSGGISKNDTDKIIKLKQNYPKMKGVDINSKFEIRPGIKNIEQVNTFIKTLKSS